MGDILTWFSLASLSTWDCLGISCLNFAGNSFFLERREDGEVDKDLLGDKSTFSKCGKRLRRLVIDEDLGVLKTSILVCSTCYDLFDWIQFKSVLFCVVLVRAPKLILPLMSDRKLSNFERNEIFNNGPFGLKHGTNQDDYLIFECLKRPFIFKCTLICVINCKKYLNFALKLSNAFHCLFWHLTIVKSFVEFPPKIDTFWLVFNVFDSFCGIDFTALLKFTLFKCQTNQRQLVQWIETCTKHLINKNRRNQLKAF